MEFRIFTEPHQGASYDDLLAVAQASETLGFDAFFRSDHYMKMGTHFDGLPGPTDAWTTLGALARETTSIRLGTLVSSVTYRYPGILAVQVAQVDNMSHGRIELGLGSGWYEAEHRAYGIPFPAKRFDLLEEQLAIISGLWETPSGETFSFAGEHYTLEDSPALPKPYQSRIPIIVGGQGPTRTPALAARYASEYNAGFPAVADIPGLFGRVREACERIERDPDDLVYSIGYTIAAGQDEAEVSRRAIAAGENATDLRVKGLCGTPSEIVDKLGRVQELGVSRIYLEVMDLHDLDHLDFIAREIVPQLG
ncbi:MAG TPA: LLM class F420-dependent oxidoreductase [Galbitalea sp.]|jgi:F420-dependent oxidoreductase-like protein